MDKMLYENLKKDISALKNKVNNINEWIKREGNNLIYGCDPITESGFTCIYKEGDWVIRIVDKDEPNHYVGRIFKILKVEGSIIHECNGITHWAPSIRLATNEEIQSHLIKGAIKKGLLGWSKFNWDYDKEITTIIAGYGYEYDANLDALLVQTHEKEAKRAIYQRGKWANPIFDKKELPKTIEEFESVFRSFAQQFYASDYYADRDYEVDKFLKIRGYK